jgi:DOMON domain
MSRKALLLAFAMSHIGASSATPTALSSPPLPRSVEAAGVRLEWVIRDAQVHACMQAATRGWVTVGFNTQPTLDGARLVMGRVVNGRAEAQVHIAKPPQHFHRLTPQGKDRVSSVSGSKSAGITRVCFSMPLAAADREDVGLRAGQNTHIILAWSHEADFEHHSAQRSAVQVVL